MFTAEEIDGEEWGVIDEGMGWTGALVEGGMGEKAAKFYAGLMNAVYDRVKKDIEDGYIKGDKA